MSKHALGLALLGAAVIAGSSPASAQTAIQVTLNLSRYSTVQHAPAGQYAGVSPGVIRVHVGDYVVFYNSDSAHHTATSIAGATTFPEEPRWSVSVLKASGSIGSDNWSTGDLAPGARSAPIEASKAGTYLYGCFFDYSAGMRGVIIVEP